MSKPKVLIAEDEVDVLEYLNSYIPLLGYEVETAQDGVETLAKVNAFHPQLLMLDIVMPKMDGVAVLKELRRHHKALIVLVATATRMTERELKALGADAVIYKPLDLTILSEQIKTLLPASDHFAPTDTEYARLLIVEDETDISDYLKEIIFDPLGYEVYTAKDADEGYRISKDRQPHIVIVDLAIPSKDHGYNLVQKLTHAADFPAPKSIIIATAALGDTSETLRRQGYTIFDKPIDYERLKERVFEACRKYGLRLKTGSGK